MSTAIAPDDTTELLEALEHEPGCDWEDCAHVATWMSRWSTPCPLCPPISLECQGHHEIIIAAVARGDLLACRHHRIMGPVRDYLISTERL